MSYNFNPQPSSRPLPFSMASMQVPIEPKITFPIPKDLYYATSYHSGAVRINQGNFLDGFAAFPNVNFDKFVCSFWATNLTLPAVYPGPPFPFQNYFFNFAPEGTFFDASFLSFPIQGFVIQIQSNGSLGIIAIDSFGGFLCEFFGCPDIMGWNETHHQILPTGVWHNYIISFDGSIPRAQIACDRGGGFAWGGGIMDSNLGILSAPPVTFHPGTAPQAMWSGFISGPTSFTNPSDMIWRMQAPTSSLIDLAYFYLGTSTTFFDLTAPGNLDYFVTTSLTPVNLGRGGSNVPLTCLVMHTGNVSDPFIGGKLQFPYNAATGALWGGVLSDAPTEPPVGA